MVDIYILLHIAVLNGLQNWTVEHTVAYVMQYKAGLRAQRERMPPVNCWKQQSTKQAEQPFG